MRTFMLLAICGFTALTQTVTVQPLPSGLVMNDYRNRKVGLFFIEVTYTIPVNTFSVDPTAEYIFWETGVRPTSTNADQTDRVFEDEKEYKFYFATDKDIEIFYRSANTPIWYGIAVGATAIAMVIFYFILKKKTVPTGV